MGFVGGGIANGDYMNFSGTTSFLTLNKSHVNDNNAPNAGGGGGIQNLLGSVTLNSSQVDRNTAPNGAGIASGNGTEAFRRVSHLVLNKSEVDGNTATAAPGEGPPIAGGGIANGGEAVLNNSEVDNNTASHASGAGIVNHGAMTLNKSEVNGNMAAGSGPVASGGGIINGQGPPGQVTPSSLSITARSTTTPLAATEEVSPTALARWLPGAPVTLNHSQVTGNTAAHGGGIFNFGGTVTLKARLLPATTPTTANPQAASPAASAKETYSSVNPFGEQRQQASTSRPREE